MPWCLSASSVDEHHPWRPRLVLTPADTPWTSGVAVAVVENSVVAATGAMERRSPSHKGRLASCHRIWAETFGWNGRGHVPRPGITRTAQNMMKREMEKGTSNATRVRCIGWLKQCFFGRDQTPKVTRAACFESEQKTYLFTARDEKTNPSGSFSKTSEFRSVVAARGWLLENARWRGSHT